MRHRTGLWKCIRERIPVKFNGQGFFRSRKSYLKFSGLLSACSAVAVFLFLAASCTSETRKFHFRTSGEAVTAYREHLSVLQGTDSMDLDKLAVSMASWQELRDSVSAALRRDTFRQAHEYPEETFRAVHGSIAGEYQRLALAEPRTYRDLLYLKEYGTPLKRCEELHRKSELMWPFFSRLDSVPLYNDAPKKALDRYDRFLSETLQNGINDKQHFMEYLRNEDRLFRTYMIHLPELAGVSMAGITDKTERCCLLAMQCAARGAFPVEEAVDYLTVRTGRRLLQNAEACMKDIRDGRLESPEQAQAYLWMLMQPLMGMDADGIALLTPEQKRTLYDLADNMPALLDRLCPVLGYDRERLEEMPGLLMKIHIATL